MGCPDGDGAEDGGGAVGDGEFVVAGGQAAPLFDGVESALDHIAPTGNRRRRRPPGVLRGGRVACGALSDLTVRG
jgi:hypothetical protein